MGRASTLPLRIATDVAEDDVTVVATFRLADPLGLTDVAVEPEPVSTEGLLGLIDAAIARLAAYRDAYSAAVAADTPPIVLPVPWHGWGR